MQSCFFSLLQVQEQSNELPILVMFTIGKSYKVDCLVNIPVSFSMATGEMSRKSLIPINVLSEVCFSRSYTESVLILTLSRIYSAIKLIEQTYKKQIYFISVLATAYPILATPGFLPMQNFVM